MELVKWTPQSNALQSVSGWRVLNNINPRYEMSDTAQIRIRLTGKIVDESCDWLGERYVYLMFGNGLFNRAVKFTIRELVESYYKPYDWYFIRNKLANAGVYFDLVEY